MRPPRREGALCKALAGEIAQFTGVDNPYEEPDDAEVVADTVASSPAESVALVLGSSSAAASFRPLPRPAELVAERDERLAGLVFDVTQLFARQVFVPAAGRPIVNAGERICDELHGDAELLGNGRRRASRVGDELLVPEHDRAVGHRSGRGHVPAPRPGRPPGV